MKTNAKKTPKYTDDLGDAAGLSAARPLTRAQERALGIPAPSEAAALPTRILHGGARKGAGRKASGHVRMQILVAPKTRDRIARLAKREGKTLSAIIESRFAA